MKIKHLFYSSILILSSWACKSTDSKVDSVSTQANSSSINPHYFHSTQSWLWSDINRKEMIEYAAWEFNPETETWTQNQDFINKARPVSDPLTVKAQGIVDDIDRFVRANYPEQTRHIPKPEVIVSDYIGEADAYVTGYPFTPNFNLTRPGVKDANLEVTYLTIDEENILIDEAAFKKTPYLPKQSTVPITDFAEWLNLINSKHPCQFVIKESQILTNSECNVFDIGLYKAFIAKNPNMSEEDIFAQMDNFTPTGKISAKLNLKSTVNKIFLFPNKKPNLESDLVSLKNTLIHEITHYYRTHASALISTKISSKVVFSIYKHNFEEFPENDPKLSNLMDRYEELKQDLYYTHPIPNQLLHGLVKNTFGENVGYFSQYNQCRGAVDEYNQLNSKNPNFVDFPGIGFFPSDQNDYLTFEKEMVNCFKNVNIYESNRSKLYEIFELDQVQNVQTAYDLAKFQSKVFETKFGEINSLVEKMIELGAVNFNPEVDAELNSISLYKPLGYKSVMDLIFSKLTEKEDQGCKNHINKFLASEISEEKLLQLSVRETVLVPFMFLNEFYAHNCLNAAAKTIMAKKVGLLPK